MKVVKSVSSVDSIFINLCDSARLTATVTTLTYPTFNSYSSVKHPFYLSSTNPSLRCRHLSKVPRRLSILSAPLFSGGSTSFARKTSASMSRCPRYVLRNPLPTWHLDIETNFQQACRRGRPKLGQIVPARESHGHPVPPRC